MRRAGDNGQCVGSGYCCRKAPCGWSQHQMAEEGLKWDPAKGCPYLVLVGIQWRCGIFLKADAAKQAAMTEDMGIGFGCSSTIGNTARDQLLLRLRSSSASPATSSASSADKTR